MRVILLLTQNELICVVLIPFNNSMSSCSMNDEDIFISPVTCAADHRIAR